MYQFTNRPRRFVVGAVLAGLAASALVACSADAGDGGSGGGQEITVLAMNNQQQQDAQP